MRVALVRLSSLGDIVHTWPLAEALRAAQPDIHLTWVVEESFEPLVNGINNPTFTVPVTATSGTTYARFRVGWDNDFDYVGSAFAGTAPTAGAISVQGQVACRYACSKPWVTWRTKAGSRSRQ